LIILRPVPKSLPPTLQEVVDYRKSGLSLNHVVGCPLDCGYCVRRLFDNFDMKKPHLVTSDEEAVERLISHWAFRPHKTPVQIFNRATDPFLPGVKEHLFATLALLDQLGLTNTVLVITRWKIQPEDIEILDSIRNLQVTVLVTWSGIEDKRIEPVESQVAEASLQALANHAKRTKSILYWRPLIAGLNDTEDHLQRALRLASLADATVFTGLFYREQIRAHLRDAGVADVYDEIARRKILPLEVEQRVLRAFADRPLFRKTSCGVAYAHKVADYNGHFGIREICDICPAAQASRCSESHRIPSLDQAQSLATVAGLSPDTVTVDARCIQVSGSSEQQRYFMQHSLNFQVHDRATPHMQYRHGRAEIGWS